MIYPHIFDYPGSTYSIANFEQEDSSSEIDTGFWSGVMGHIESSAISVMDTVADITNWDYDILYSSFKDVDIISQNLSQEEMKKVYLEVDKDFDGTNLQKIQKLTFILLAISDIKPLTFLAVSIEEQPKPIVLTTTCFQMGFDRKW